MKLREKIQDHLVVEDKKYLEDNLESVKQFISLSEDGMILIEVEGISKKDKVLLYLLGRKYAERGGFVKDDFAHYKTISNKTEINDGTVRASLGDWTEKGFVKKRERGEYEIEAKKLPEIIEYLEGNYGRQ